MKGADLARVEDCLRSMLGNSRLRVVSGKLPGASAEVWNDREFIGTLHCDDDGGEVSYSVHIVLLEEDLPEQPSPRRKVAPRRA
ncbi:MAG: DUF3126 family protein [Alphaproteobacteria bacterium]|nr:DUF3126 family protein [Alphaproteobacteria bacterium]